MTAQNRYDLNALFLFVLLGAATAADAQVQPQLAQRYFEEATTLCERDAGRLWGVSLCGPMVIFDQATGTRATSQPEPAGPTPRFSGFADGPVTWGGVLWFSFPLSFLPEKDAATRQQVMLHGLFHRIQPGLGLITDDGSNEHLDTLEGRVWMQLEWRALRRAVESSGSNRAEAIADALAFRRERRRLFPGAADNERRDEIREGLASYTGIAAWANSPADPTVPQLQSSQEANCNRPSSEISKPRPDPLTVCCWTISCRDGADRFVAPRTLATCSPPQRTGHRRRILPLQRRATMAQRCERRRRRAIGRSRSASPSCVDASLMGPC
jgi:hypothetical protein